MMKTGKSSDIQPIVKICHPSSASAHLRRGQPQDTRPRRRDDALMAPRSRSRIQNLERHAARMDAIIDRGEGDRTSRLANWTGQ